MNINIAYEYNENGISIQTTGYKATLSQDDDRWRIHVHNYHNDRVGKDWVSWADTRAEAVGMAIDVIHDNLKVKPIPSNT